MPINPIPIFKDDDVGERKKIKKELEFVVCDPKYTFEDVILSQDILQEIDQVIALENYKQLIFDTWGLKQVLKRNKNITINLYGQSGTGKTITAHAIAHELNKKILIVNYSDIESKYVGETSKNLVNLFKFAKLNDAIILFDEADALLSRRVTAMNSATDVSVNQTRNVLLKLLDEHEGIILFTTNFIQNFDSAFFRRIMSHVKFDMPNKEMRMKLWEHYIVTSFPLKGERSETIDKLSEVENVSGSDISNSVLKTAIRIALEKKDAAELQDFNSELTKILVAKRAIEGDNFTVTTKKVSEEYVKEKLGKESVINGNYTMG